MFDDFVIKDRWTGEDIHCQYQALIVAISTRHADAIDIKFLANDRPVWVALPHRTWPEYLHRSGGKVLTDPMAVQGAGHYLKTSIETGMDSGREMYTLGVEEALQHVDAAMHEISRATARRA